MKSLFLWEIKKNVKRSAIIGVSVAALVMLVLLAIVYNLLNDFAKQITTNLSDVVSEGENGEEILTNEDIIQMYSNKISFENEEEVDDLLNLTREELATAEEMYAKKKSESNYNAVYKAKSQIKILEYVKEKKLYGEEVDILGVTGEQLSAEGFTELYKDVMKLIVSIYAIVLASGIFCGEYKSGTVKLLFSKPVKRSAVTLSKLLTVYAVITVAYIVPVFVAFAYGGIAFGTISSAKVVYSFNAMSATSTTYGALVFGGIVSDLVYLYVLATVAFSLSTIAKNTAVGIIASLAIALGLGSFLSVLGINTFLLSNALDFVRYFGINSVSLYGNFFISLAIIVFWTALSLFGVFYVTEKRDV